MNISEEKLMLLHMGELSPEESAELLKSAEVCDQLKLLEADMQAFELKAQNTLPEDYGHQLWNRISEDIKAEEASFNEPGIFKKIADWFHTPQFSFASMAMVAMLVITAYWMGRQDVIDNTDFSQQLLAQNLQMHLTQSEIFLTQVSHQSNNKTDADTGTELKTMAQRLLISNRIYKKALAGYDSQFTQQVLSDLEPVLLEVANRSNSQLASMTVAANSANTNQKLLFQVKSMKQQLANNNTII